MKITYTDMQDMAKEVVGLSDAATLNRLRLYINIGAGKVLAAMQREYNRKERYTDLKDGQQYYQLPEDGQKLKEVVASTGSGWYPPLEQIADEHSWLMINMTRTTGMPTHYFIKGYDQLGLYPTPSSTVEDGLMLVFSPKHVQMTQEDYKTGTVIVTENSQTVTGSGTNFTANMVGQWFQTTDGSDGNWYKISEVDSATSLTLDNFYQGLSGGTKTYRIGQVVDLPEEFAEAPSDFACYRHYLKRGDKVKSDMFDALFTTAIDQIKEQYATTTDDQIVWAEPQYQFYNPFRGDPPPGGLNP